MQGWAQLKDRNGKDLTEAEEIKKRWQEYTEEWNKKGLNDTDNHDGVITHLEPDILKWALGNASTNKADGGDEILAELFQILKDDAIKVLHLLCQQNWKTQQWPQDTPTPKGSANQRSIYHTTVLVSDTSKVLLKNLPTRLQQYVSHLRTSRCASWI